MRRRCSAGRRFCETAHRGDVLAASCIQLQCQQRAHCDCLGTAPVKSRRDRMLVISISIRCQYLYNVSCGADCAFAASPGPRPWRQWHRRRHGRQASLPQAKQLTAGSQSALRCRLVIAQSSSSIRDIHACAYCMPPDSICDKAHRCSKVLTQGCTVSQAISRTVMVQPGLCHEDLRLLLTSRTAVRSDNLAQSKLRSDPDQTRRLLVAAHC